MLPAETQAELLAPRGRESRSTRRSSRGCSATAAARSELPETVQGLIAARLDLLEPDEKALLQDAAVIGKRFWTGALASFAGLDDGARAGAALHALERREFVRRERSSSVADESEYAFRHLLVRDVAYGQIPRAERAEKHLARGRVDRAARPAARTTPRCSPTTICRRSS